MFSVNVNKLTIMTDTEMECYMSIVAKVISECREECKSLGIIGDPKCAFKLAASMAEIGKNTLFIDADNESSIFLSKYKLGKSLKGIAEYLVGEEEYDNLKCATNKDNLTLMFTGNIEKVENYSQYSEKILSLMAQATADYELVIVLSDKCGVVSEYCGSTILVADEKGYSEEKTSAFIEELEDKGCQIMGVIINEAQ